jgi:hypothetical protein
VTSARNRLRVDDSLEKKQRPSILPNKLARLDQESQFFHGNGLPGMQEIGIPHQSSMSFPSMMFIELCL